MKLADARRIVVALVLVCAPSLAQPTRMLESEAAMEDARLARRAVEMIHPGLERYTDRAELNAAFDALESACVGPVSEREFYAKLSVALAKIRCSHTKAETSKAWDQWRETTPSYLPLRFVEDSGRMFVTASACDGLARGDEVLAIDGVSAGEVMSAILAAVPADGFTDGARRHGLAAASDLDESELDHYLPALFGFGPTVRLEVRSPGAETTRSLSVAMQTRQARRDRLNEPERADDLDEAVSLDLRPDGVAVLRIGTFVAYRKNIAPETIYRPLFERLAQSGVKTLVIDLRDNGGGSDSAVIDLMRFVLREPVAPETRAWVRTYSFGDLKDRLETWDRSILSMPAEAFTKLDNGYFELRREAPEPIEPASPGFRGRVIALTGPANASGSTLCLAALRRYADATLVGEPTGGAVDGPTAGVIFFLPLPNSGIRVRIPAIRSVTGLNADPPGQGLTPDVLVRPTLADRMGGRDVVLERALELARPTP